MDENRADRVWASIHAVARVDGRPLSIRHACIACVRAVGAIGAGLSMARGEQLREPVLATEPVSQELEELQFTLGEGPCMDAVAWDEAVLVADLSTAESQHRWPVFALAAVERGAQGMLAMPVRIGAARLGILDVYWRTAGRLSVEKLTDALGYADAVLVLALDDRGGIAPELEKFGDGGLVEWRTEVHQATGMISVQLGVDVTESLVRLRAYAYLHDRRLAEVAADVVARRLRFHPDDGDGASPRGDASLPGGPHNNKRCSKAAPPSGIDNENEGEA